MIRVLQQRVWQLHMQFTCPIVHSEPLCWPMLLLTTCSCIHNMKADIHSFSFSCDAKPPQQQPQQQQPGC